MMNIYEVDTGATYWVVAQNLLQAFDVARACWESEGSLEDVASTDSVSIDQVYEERARKIKIQMDDEAGSQRLLWDVARDATKPEVVACSEWP
jgi:hypothetical protein